MDGARESSIVDEAHNYLPTLLDDEGGARGDTVIANENSFALVGVDVLGELVDVHLIIVYQAAGDRVRDGPVINSSAIVVHEVGSLHNNSHDRCFHWRDWKRELVKPTVGWAFPVLPGDQFRTSA
jgi:hypothetical protein